MNGAVQRLVLLVVLLILSLMARGDDIDVLKAQYQNNDVGGQPQVMIIFDNSGSMADTPNGEKPTKECDWEIGDRETDKECSRMEIAQQVVMQLVSNNAGINFALAVFNENNDVSVLESSLCYQIYYEPSVGWALGYTDSINSPECWIEGDQYNGGRIVSGFPDPDLDIKIQSATSRSELVKIIDKELQPQTSTPLCETMYEVYRYFKGEEVLYGIQGGEDTPAQNTPSDGSSQYRSPLRACQSVYVIYMTDGQPQWDTHANDAIKSLTQQDDCKTYDWAPPVTGVTAGQAENCLPALTEYMRTHDLSDKEGIQHAYTYTIGFTTDQELLEDAASPLLDENGNETGQKGYFTAYDSAGLAAAFKAIVGNIRAQQSLNNSRAFASDFNQLRNLDFAYVPQFQAKQNEPWIGNLKKYAFDQDTNILDSQEAWSQSSVAQEDVEAGGAGQLLRNRSNPRSLFTDIVGVNAFGVTARGKGFSLEDVKQWLRTGTVNNHQEITRSWPLADIIHSRPLAFNRGCPASETDCNDGDHITLFVGSNDGLLHAFDDASGRESWTYWPAEVADAPIYRMFEPESGSDSKAEGDNAVYQARDVNTDNGNGKGHGKGHGETNKGIVITEEGTQGTNYGVDGSPALLAVDADNNGYIGDATDTAILAFGFRRGGYGYYGLNVLDPAQPALKWRVSTRDGDDFKWLGQSWSTPRPALIARTDDKGKSIVNAIQGRRVFIFGGGYERLKDKSDFRVQNIEDDPRGTGLYVINAENGTLIHAFEQHTGQYAQLQDSVPGDVTLADLNYDGLIDSIFFADTGGNVWMADISAPNPNDWELFQIARLGRHDSDPVDRRFFTAPDLVRTRLGDVDFDFLVVASGDRAHLQRTDASDAIFILNVTPLAQGAASSRLLWSPWSASNDLNQAPNKVSDTAVDQMLTLPDAALRSQAALERAASDITDAFAGWQIPLSRPASGGSDKNTDGLNPGRKALSNSQTILGITFLTAYQPQSSEVCKPLDGESYLYALTFPQLDPQSDTSNGYAYVQREHSGQLAVAEAGNALLDDLSLHVSDSRVQLAGVGQGALEHVMAQLNGMSLDQKPLVPTWWYQEDSGY